MHQKLPALCPCAQLSWEESLQCPPCRCTRGLPFHLSASPRGEVRRKPSSAFQCSLAGHPAAWCSSSIARPCQRPLDRPSCSSCWAPWCRLRAPHPNRRLERCQFEMHLQHALNPGFPPCGISRLASLEASAGESFLCLWSCEESSPPRGWSVVQTGLLLSLSRKTAALSTQLPAFMDSSSNLPELGK